PGGITVAGGAQLNVSSGNALALVGGAQTFAGSAFVPSGRFDLIAIGSSGEVATTAATGEPLAVTGVTNYASLTVTPFRFINVAGSGGANGGTFGFVGEDVQLNGTVQFGATSTGAGGWVAGQAGQLDIGGLLFGTTFDGPGGGVVLDVGDLNLL